MYVVEGTSKKLCGRVSWRPSVHVYPINCSGKKGSVVRIEQKYNYLTLAEVQVFGTGGSPPKAPDFGAFYTSNVGSK